MKVNNIFFLLIITSLMACRFGEQQAGVPELSKTLATREFSEADAFFEEFSEEETPPPQIVLNQPKSPPPGKDNKEPQSDKPIGRQIIRTANYRIQVKNVTASAQNATRMAEKFGGYVSESSLSNSSSEITQKLTIRVPVNQFDTLLSEIGREALFTNYLHISSQDVTEEYVDVLTRLKTKKEVRDRYVDILRNKARSVEEILKAEEQIRVIQEEIESKEGRLRYLKDQVAMSTIHLEMYQVVQYRTEPDVIHTPFSAKLINSMKDGWYLLQNLLLLIVSAWPLIIMGLLIYWQRKRMRSWFGRRSS